MYETGAPPPRRPCRTTASWSRPSDSRDAGRGPAGGYDATAAILASAARRRAPTTYRLRGAGDQRSGRAGRA